MKSSLRGLSAGWISFPFESRCGHVKLTAADAPLPCTQIYLHQIEKKSGSDFIEPSRAHAI